MASTSRAKTVSRSGKPTSSVPKSPESYHSLRQRTNAAEILQSYEKLSWFSMQRCESLTQTRLHFQNIIAGFTSDDEAALVDWKEDFTPRNDDRERDKGKQRASDVGVAAAAAGSAKKKRKSDGRVVS